MSPNPDVLFQAATHPHQFSAIGYLLGSFQPTPTEEIKHFIPGKFLTSEGIELSDEAPHQTKIKTQLI